MHLGNGIICPVTGIPMMVVTGIAAFYAYKKSKDEFTKDKIFPTIALSSLVFALQMINFSIPQVGSSGHIIGGILLASLLGPYIAFLSICSILLVQSVFFADGGLLALGCNIFNMGFVSCFIVYPLLYKPLSDKNKPVLGAILSSIIALELGAFSVVAEAILSGSVTGNLLMFMGLMQGIHLIIGIVEGGITGGIILLAKHLERKKLSFIFAGTAVILGGFIAKYASTKPDGLEWSLLSISDCVNSQTQYVLYNIFETIQAKSAIFASMPYLIGNLAGIAVLSIIMYCICKMLSFKMVSNEQ